MNSNPLFVRSFFVTKLVVLVLALSINSAIAQQAETEAAAAPSTADSLGSNVKAKGAPEVVDPGMQIPVDGSSLEAFNESLATIKEKAQEPNYISLEEAIKYLLVYDLGAGRDKAKLAKNLDGLTGDQIIDKVQWRKSP